MDFSLVKKYGSRSLPYTQSTYDFNEAFHMRLAAAVSALLAATEQLARHCKDERAKEYLKTSKHFLDLLTQPPGKYVQ